MLRDNHTGYTSLREYGEDRKRLLDNALKKNCARKVTGTRSAHEGDALWSGRMMRDFYSVGNEMLIASNAG